MYTRPANNKSPLVTVLSLWDGHKDLKNMMESRGFHVPSRYQERIVALSGCGLMDLNLYWEEVSKEYVRSAGRNDVESREFRIGAAYKSPYLETLADNIRKVENISLKEPPFFPLLPCLREFEKKKYNDPEIGPSLVRNMTSVKVKEVSKNVDLAENFSPTKRCVRQTMLTIGQRLGASIERESIVLSGGKYLKLRMSFDIGGRPNAIGLPIDVSLSHVEQPSYKFSILWYRILPGFHLYNIHDSAEECILGIDAYFAMADLFLNQLLCSG